MRNAYKIIIITIIALSIIQPYSHALTQEELDIINFLSQYLNLSNQTLIDIFSNNTTVPSENFTVYYINASYFKNITYYQNENISGQLAEFNGKFQKKLNEIETENQEKFDSIRTTYATNGLKNK